MSISKRRWLPHASVRMPRKKIKRTRPANRGRIKAPPVKSISSDAVNPIFSLRHLDKNFSLTKCTKEEKAAFADTLYKLSQLSWQELRQAPRHGLSYERISINAIRGAIPSHIAKEVGFIAFRFYGKAPIVGYRDGEIFHIVWVDREFKLYAHG